MEQLEAAIRPDTSLVSVMLVNNEIGVIQVLARRAADLEKTNSMNSAEFNFSKVFRQVFQRFSAQIWILERANMK